MTRAEAIHRLKNMAWLYDDEREQNIEAIDMAIEALSAPQTDLISRADAIELFEKYKPRMAVSVYEYGQALEALPSAEAEWIPCSERLPKEKARVLTYDSMGGIVFGQYDKGRWYWEAEACADYWAKNDGVIAWMPLPTPYKGE